MRTHSSVGGHMLLNMIEQQERRNIVKNILHRTIAVLAAAFLLAGCAEQTKPEPPDPEPLVINTVERQDDIVLTVMRGEETVFQYAGSVELWKGSDGKAYGVIYLDGEEVEP